MSIEQNRETIRAQTSYRAGRIAVDVLLVLWWIAALVLLVMFFLSYQIAMEGSSHVLEVTLAVAGAVIGSVAILAVREVAHVLFDMADRNLVKK